VVLQSGMKAVQQEQQQGDSIEMATIDVGCCCR
jgi:hypothetical protein